MKSKDMWQGTVGISMIVAIGAIVGGIAYLLWGPSIPYWPFGNPPIATTTATIISVPTVADLSSKDGTLFLCEDGSSLKATFFANAVRLALSDGREISLSQVIGETGVRYANPDESFMFLNEGNVVFIRENGLETYSGCVAGDQ